MQSSVSYPIFILFWITKLYMQIQMNPNKGLKILFQMHSLQKKMFAIFA